MSHKFILQFYIRGNKRKPSMTNVGRFKASSFDYPNIDVLFSTEAKSHEKLYDINYNQWSLKELESGEGLKYMINLLEKNKN